MPHPTHDPATRADQTGHSADLFAQLATQAQAIAALAQGVTPAQARYRPTPDDWSLLEVLTHLLDEERFDFRVRLDILLHTPDRPWPPIDPAGWVVERRYNAGDLATTVAAFTAEREQSLGWLRGLVAPDWSAEGPTPWGGAISAGAMLASWVAHDLLHLRQLAALRHAWLTEQVGAAAVRYAGAW